MDRALRLGLPIAIEQDLHWHAGRSVVAHDPPKTTDLPDLRSHFFERVRPLIEKALRENQSQTWPLVVLNLDFKTNEPEHHAAVWRLLGEYEAWLSTAARTAGGQPEPIDWKPVLVLTGSPASQEAAFHDSVPVGGRLRLFGAALSEKGALPAAATNYRRWWNNPWSVVEKGGQRKAGPWTARDERRLHTLAAHAHRQGLWLRFYTLNGHPMADAAARGWGDGYNFGSLAAARARWQAAIRAKVDFIATDQYEELAAVLAQPK